MLSPWENIALSCEKQDRFKDLKRYFSLKSFHFKALVFFFCHLLTAHPLFPLVVRPPCYCVHVRKVCLFAGVCMRVHEPSVTEYSRDSRILSRVQSTAVQRSPLPPSLSLFPSHDVFHLPGFSYSLSLLGSLCPFPPHLPPVNNTETK